MYIGNETSHFYNLITFITIQVLDILETVKKIIIIK